MKLIEFTRSGITKEYSASPPQSPKRHKWKEKGKIYFYMGNSLQTLEQNLVNSDEPHGEFHLLDLYQSTRTKSG